MSGLWGEDEKDDVIAKRLNEGVEAISDRRTLMFFLLTLTAVNVLIWLAVSIFPFEVREAFGRVSDTDNKLGAIVLGLVFGVGMWISYSLFRLKFPDIEEQRLDQDVMASFAYQSESTKRFRIWVLSAVGGVLNVGALVLLDLWRTSN